MPVLCPWQMRIATISMLMVSSGQDITSIQPKCMMMMHDKTHSINHNFCLILLSFFFSSNQSIYKIKDFLLYWQIVFLATNLMFLIVSSFLAFFAGDRGIGSMFKMSQKLEWSFLVPDFQVGTSGTTVCLEWIQVGIILYS